MQDFITLGTAPIDEPCAQLGQSDDDGKARAACRRFLGRLRQTFGDEPPGARFAITSFPRDFGTSYEVVVLFDTENEQAAHYAYRCENEMPATWEGS